MAAYELLLAVVNNQSELKITELSLNVISRLYIYLGASKEVHTAIHVVNTIKGLNMHQNNMRVLRTCFRTTLAFTDIGISEWMSVYLHV